ncbi:hypothetical protein [Micromonospora sp. DT229]|uniref:hypothetical protein n=1 Tax=Micromonospora sp. DT229 TaxID=3393430 RepID=UPI003CF14902
MNQMPTLLTVDAVPERVAAAAVLAEVGIDLGDACPIISGKRYLDWDLADLTDDDLDVTRAVRDDIDTRVRALLEDLTDHRTHR